MFILILIHDCVRCFPSIVGGACIISNYISPALECIGAVQRGREKEHKSR